MSTPPAASPVDSPVDGLEWADSHCHLPDDLTEAAAAVDAARNAGVKTMITVGCDLATSRIAITHAKRFDGVYASAGVHPHEARHGIDGLAELVGDDDIVAVGECGLDYFYDHSPRAEQRAVFAAQIGLAHDSGKPLIIHSRDAWDDTFAVLDGEGMPPRTVFHCFTGGPAEAAKALERGAWLSFSGIVTFKSAADVRAAAVDCPLTRLLVETDAPYLTPEPHRGRPNQPAFVQYVGEQIAALHELDVAELAAATTATTREFFGLPAQA